MDRDRLAGFGFVVLGLLQLVPIVTAGSLESIAVFTLLRAIGGLALAGLGARLMYQRDGSEGGKPQSHLTGAMVALAAVSLFVGGVAYAFLG